MLNRFKTIIKRAATHAKAYASPKSSGLAEYAQHINRGGDATRRAAQAANRTQGVSTVEAAQEHGRRAAAAKVVQQEKAAAAARADQLKASQQQVRAEARAAKAWARKNKQRVAAGAEPLPASTVAAAVPAPVPHVPPPAPRNPAGHGKTGFSNSGLGATPKPSTGAPGAPGAPGASAAGAGAGAGGATGPASSAAGAAGMDPKAFDDAVNRLIGHGNLSNTAALGLGAAAVYFGAKGTSKMLAQSTGLGDAETGKGFATEGLMTLFGGDMMVPPGYGMASPTGSGFSSGLGTAAGVMGVTGALAGFGTAMSVMPKQGINPFQIPLAANPNGAFSWTGAANGLRRTANFGIRAGATRGAPGMAGAMIGGAVAASLPLRFAERLSQNILSRSAQQPSVLQSKRRRVRGSASGTGTRYAGDYAQLADGNLTLARGRSGGRAGL